jgi:low affinity Fe/Cu permease
MKKYTYFLLLAMVLGMLVLFGDMFNFITDNAIKIVILVAAGMFLLSYLIIKYRREIMLRKQIKDELNVKQNKETKNSDNSKRKEK